MNLSEQKSRSVLWYLLPLLIPYVGGMIAYFILRKTDSKKAKISLIMGIGIGVTITGSSILLNNADLPDTELGNYISEYGIGVFIGECLVFVIPIIVGYHIFNSRRNNKKIKKP